MKADKKRLPGCFAKIKWAPPRIACKMCPYLYQCNGAIAKKNRRQAMSNKQQEHLISSLRDQVTEMGTDLADKISEIERLLTRITEFRQRAEKAERERNAWRAATGLAIMTPEQAGDRLDEIEEAAKIMSEMVSRYKAELEQIKSTRAGI